MSDIAITIPCHARTVRGLDQPRVFVNEGKVVANSEDVASYFGKQHSHVLRDIRRLIQGDNSCASNFGWTYRDMRMPSGGTRPIATCNMTRDGLTLLAMGFTGKRALGWKLKYIEAFNRMEAELAKPYQVDDDEPAPKAKPKWTPITEPITRSPVDRMDCALDMVLTVEIALRAKEWIGSREIDAFASTLEQALKMIAPAREALDKAA